MKKALIFTTIFLSLLAVFSFFWFNEDNKKLRKEANAKRAISNAEHSSVASLSCEDLKPIIASTTLPYSRSNRTDIDVTITDVMGASEMELNPEAIPFKFADDAADSIINLYLARRDEHFSLSERRQEAKEKLREVLLVCEFPVLSNNKKYLATARVESSGDEKNQITLKLIKR